MNWGATKQSLIAVSGLCSALAFGLVMLGTEPPGPGLYGDSAGYLGAAQSLVRSGTLRVPFAEYTSADSTAPLAQWPPGFSTAIAGPMLVGLDPVTSARFAVAAAAAVTAAALIWLLGAWAGAAWGVVALTAAALTASVTAVHLEVLSEPLFLALALVTLALMVARPDRPLAYGLTAAATVLTRYMGLGVVAGVAIWAALQPGNPRTRVQRAAIAVLPGLAAYMLWSLFTRHEGSVVRSMHLDHYPLVSLRQWVGGLLAWLAPDDATPRGGALRLARTLLKALLLAGLVSVGLTVYRTRAASDPARRLLTGSLLLALGSAGILLVAQWLQSNVAFYARMFSPVHALLDVAAVAALAAWWRGAPGVRARATALVAGLTWAAVSGLASAAIVHEARTRGLDHASVETRTSPLWQWVRDSASRHPGALYSNDVADIYFATHRPSRWMPFIVTPDTARNLAEALRRRPGLVIWATGYTKSVVYAELRDAVATPEQIESLLKLQRIATFSDGVVWLNR